jgi:hypothetical protein
VHLGLTQLDHVAIRQSGGCSNGYVVHEGAVQGPDVVDHEPFFGWPNDGMPSGDLGIIEYQIDSLAADQSL